MARTVIIRKDHEMPAADVFGATLRETIARASKCERRECLVAETLAVLFSFRPKQKVAIQFTIERINRAGVRARDVSFRLSGLPAFARTIENAIPIHISLGALDLDANRLSSESIDMAANFIRRSARSFIAGQEKARLAARTVLC